MTLATTTSCDSCDYSLREEDSINNLSLKTKEFVDISLSDRLKPSNLLKDCPICESETSFTKEMEVIASGYVMIFHLERFLYINNKAVQSNAVRTSMPISPSLDDFHECVIKQYIFSSGHNYITGTLLNGHYTVFVKDHHCNAWCNDKSITRCPKEKAVKKQLVPSVLQKILKLII